MPQIDEQLLNILKAARERRASDVHISVATVPVIRVNSQLMPMEDQARLMPDDTRRLLTSVMNEEQLQTLKKNGEVDLAFGVPELGRFRMNVYSQRGSYAAAIRMMNTRVPEPEELGLPESVIELYKKKSGLVLVTGPTGSGKSTTLASLIQKINNNRRCHILTLEDPIEYLYRHNLSLVDQREIGLDSRSFATALRAALREDPDVILVGEMRDLETISTALTAAETGHLVFSTLHTNSAAATINRIIDVFPEGQKEQLRTQLSMVLETVVSQRLVPKADGSGRVACFEVMHSTDAIRNNIRGNKIFQIANTMQTSRKEGMITMDEALAEALAAGLITRETALEYAENPDAVEKGSARVQESSEKKYSW